MIEIYILVAILVLSLFANSFQFFLYKAHKNKKPESTIDARMILHDITGGEALVRVIRIAPEDVFLRSPRD